MKKIYSIHRPKFYLGAIALVLQFMAFATKAQLVSSNAFLKGNFVEVGIAPCGSYGSSVGAPAGYHPRGRGTQLGFVADPGKDGWDVGNPNYVGDYFLPGSPEEGWGLTINGTNYNNNQICMESAIPGSIINYSSSAAENSATWQGSVSGLTINAKTAIPLNNVFFTTTVTITNTSGSTINNIFYMRNVDPDHGVPTPGAGGTSNTTNCIVSQNPNASNKVLVSATVGGNYLGLGSLDARARVAHGGFSNRNAEYIWNATGLNAAGCQTADAAIAISFKVGNLAPGEKATFSYVYVLDQTQLDAGLSATLGAVKDITCSSATFSATATKAGFGYYVVIPRDAAAPTASQVKSGASYGSVAVAAKGSSAMTANEEKAFPITGLAPGTPYDIYFVSEDGASAFSSVSKVQFATRALTVWYADADNDGFGNAAISTTACDRPAGYVDSSTDCDDSSTSTNPGAYEIPRNGIDDNCNGQVDELIYSTPAASTNPCTHMYISKVAIIGGVSGFDNASGCSSSSFTDFSNSVSATQVQGSTVNMNFQSSGYPLNYSVWIDYNDDAIFSASERVVSAGDGNLVVSASFNIPANATIGAHRMRVRGDYHGYPIVTDPSSTLQYGETEDYTLIITASNQAPVAIAKPLTLSAGDDCSASAVAADFNNGSTDTDGDALTYNVSPAGPYAVGTTTVILTVTDAKGASSASSTTITVVDDTKPIPTIASLPTITGECSATVTAPTATDACSGTVTATTSDPTSFDTQGTHIVTWTYTDAAGNKTTQEQTVLIKDVTSPTIASPVAVTVNNDEGKCGAVVSLNAPATADNCAVASVSNNAPAFFPIGTTSVSWTVEDVNGLSSSIIQQVTVKDVTAPVIASAPAVNVNTDSGVCGAKVELTVPSTSDNCGVASVTNDAPALFPVGTTTVTWTVTDIHGLTATITQIVKVTDNQSPVFAAINDIEVTTDKDVCGAMVTYEIPLAIDNCEVTTTQIAGLASGSVFPVGTTINTFKAVDASGNKSIISFSVTVTDKQAPYAIAKNISMTLVNGSASITAANLNNGSNDACGIASMTVSKSSFDCNELGDHTVTLTVTDENGNVSSTTSTVTVVGIKPAPAIAVSRTNMTNTGINTQNTIFLGYGAQSLVLTASNPASGAGATTYAWSPSTWLSNAKSANPMFAPTAAGMYTFTVTATNEFGCTAMSSVTIKVIDARCGNNGKLDKVLVCHKGQELCVAPGAVADHLAHGCTIGGCGATANPIAKASMEMAQRLRVYPNPAVDKATVEFAVTNGTYVLEIYDAKGALVQILTKGKGEPNKLFSYELAIAKYAAGVYLVRLVTEGDLQTTRLVVAK
jgi:hypothetical protein